MKRPTTSALLTLLTSISLCVFIDACGGNDSGSSTRSSPLGPSSLNTSDPFSNGTVAPLTDNPGSCGIDCCKEAMKKVDTDGDGVLDYDEVYGRPINYMGAQTIVYTDPFNPNTRGDGVGNDSQLQSNRIDGNDAITLSAPIARNPALRDYVVRVYARGGLNSQESPSDATGWVNFPDGWNAYPNLKVIPGAKVKLQELNTSTDLWSESIGGHVRVLNAKGFPGKALNRYGIQASCSPSGVLPSMADPNSCLSKDARGALIGKYSNSPSDIISPGETPFSVGSSMDTNFMTSIAAPGQNGYLMFRANDYQGRANLADNRGYITLLISITDSGTYPQVAPSGDAETKLLKKICSGAAYQQYTQGQLSF